MKTLTIKNLALTASELLNDQEKCHEFKRWSECLLQTLAVQSIKYVDQLQPGMFAHNMKQKIGPGPVSDVEIEGCNDVEKILRIWDSKGNRIVPTKADADLVAAMKKYPKRNCVRCGGKVKAIPALKYSIDLTQGNYITFSPPVPAGETWEIEFICLDADGLLSDVEAELPPEANKAVPAVLDYMLYLAYSKDFESEHSATRAANHLAAFNQHMQTIQTVG